MVGNPAVNAVSRQYHFGTLRKYDTTAHSNQHISIEPSMRFEKCIVLCEVCIIYIGPDRAQVSDVHLHLPDSR